MLYKYFGKNAVDRVKLNPFALYNDELGFSFDRVCELAAMLKIPNDSEYKVEFSSSVEDIASVDEMGYIKGLKNCDVPTIITVKLNYLGETFTDTCVVYVSVKEAFK